MGRTLCALPVGAHSVRPGKTQNVIVAVAIYELHIEYAQSLKDKRGAHIHVKIDGGPTQTLFIDGGQPLLHLTRDAHGVLHAAYDFHLGGGAR